MIEFSINFSFTLQNICGTLVSPFVLLKVHSWPPFGGVVILFETGNPFNLYRSFLHVNIVKVQLWPPVGGVVYFI